MNALVGYTLLYGSMAAAMIVLAVLTVMESGLRGS
jgi:hypothetical protein